jgi:hypothetical protein
MKNKETQTDLVIGEKYFFRTLTFYYIGILSKADPRKYVISDACCVFDTGDFEEALCKGNLEKVKRYPKKMPDGSLFPVFLNRSIVVDISPWIHDLP